MQIPSVPIARFANTISRTSGNALTLSRSKISAAVTRGCVTCLSLARKQPHAAGPEHVPFPDQPRDARTMRPQQRFQDHRCGRQDRQQENDAKKIQGGPRSIFREARPPSRSASRPLIFSPGARSCAGFCAALAHSTDSRTPPIFMGGASGELRRYECALLSVTDRVPSVLSLVLLGLTAFGQQYPFLPVAGSPTRVQWGLDARYLARWCGMTPLRCNLQRRTLSSAAWRRNPRSAFRASQR